MKASSTIVRIGGGDDPRVAAYRHVGDRAWLAAHGLFVAEGRLVVERAIRLGTLRIHSVLVTPAAFAARESLLAGLEAPVFVLEPAGVNAITGFNFHRGCLALVHRPDPRAGLDRLCEGHLLLGLEGIGNPDNLGGLFRAAAAFAVGGIVLDRRSGDPFYRKAVRTSMGAVLDLPFAQVDDWRGTLDELLRRGFRIVALTPNPQATPLARFVGTIAPTDALALLVGAEGEGLTPVSLAAAHDRVCIPVSERVDSLNVVVAAGVVLSRVAEALRGAEETHRRRGE